MSEQLSIRVRLLAQLRRYVALESPCWELRAYVGLKPHNLRAYLESYFLEGMNWENYKKVWCVDHIAPLQLFDLTKEEDMFLSWNYNNLMPMFIRDNHRKDFNCNIANRIFDFREQNEIIVKFRERLNPELPVFDKYYQFKKDRSIEANPMIYP